MWSKRLQAERQPKPASAKDNAMPEQKSSDADRPETGQPRPTPLLTAAKKIPNSEITNRETANERIHIIPRKPKWFRSIRNASPAVTAFATVGILVATVIYARYLLTNSGPRCTQFVASQQAAIYLGLPDGSTGELEQTGVFALHFRNYGLSPAENVLIEVWPAVIPNNHPQPL
jgi:hypothetical protein